MLLMLILRVRRIVTRESVGNRNIHFRKRQILGRHTFLQGTHAVLKDLTCVLIRSLDLKTDLLSLGYHFYVKLSKSFGSEMNLHFSAVLAKAFNSSTHIGYCFM